MDRLEKLKRFLQKKFPNIQAFNCKGCLGDKMKKVYDKDGITVYYCYSNYYIEISGLTNEEFEDLIERNDDPWSRFISKLKTFEFETED